MKKLTTAQLEKRMIRYRDLISVSVADNGDPMVVLDPAGIKNGYRQDMSDMTTALGNRIILRNTASQMLNDAQKRLREKNENYSLYVTYGYRSLEVQTTKFRTIVSTIAKKRFFVNPIDLYEEVHRFIAVPTVAGHPTGGAVDITIVDSAEKLIDFGSPLYDLRSKNCYVYTPNITKRALKNRLLLRECMMGAGFAPFDGEWWHFSYGDREWAFYYKKSKAIYGQLSLLQVKKLLKGSTTNIRYLTRLLW